MIRKFVAAAVLAGALFAAGCSADSGDPEPGNAPAAAPTATAPAAEPRTAEAAKAAAQAEFDAYAAGDWAGAWDLWTAAGKKAFSRDDYNRLHTECETPTGLTFDITAVRLEEPTVAVVNWKRAIAAGSHKMRYEDGHWRFQPAADDMADYKLAVDKLIAKSKADGRCG